MHGNTITHNISEGALQKQRLVTTYQVLTRKRKGDQPRVQEDSYSWVTNLSPEHDKQQKIDNVPNFLHIGMVRKYHRVTTYDWRDMCIQDLIDDTTPRDKKPLTKLKQGVWKFCTLQDLKEKYNCHKENEI